MDGVIEDMWTPYKHLYSVFQSAVSNPDGVTSDLELCLKKYKHSFTNFLRNPAKSEKSRSHLRNALNEGVPLPGQSRKVKLSQDLVDEAIILSDMFDLDEVFAVELLCTAQRQQLHHPGLPRGLVAVLLYYDGRKAISCALRDMFQAVSGVSWSTELPREVTSLVTNYAQSLVEDSNILGRLLELLEEMDVDKESILLTKNRAFGSKKHQNQVLGLYEDIQKALAMALFHWSAQRGLPRPIAIRLLQQLASRKTNDADGNIDDVTLIMLMALLYAYDTSVLLVPEYSNPHTARLPILSDPEFAKSFLEGLYAQSSWQEPRLDAIITYSFGLTLASLRHAPAQLQAAALSAINRDEILIDEALGAQVFGFFYRLLLEKDLVYSTEFIYRRVHLLITDFIDFMHAKVSELRGRADESARTIISFLNEGLEPPPNLDSNFEQLMLCVAKLYGDPRVTIKLCNEYWGPSDPSGGSFGVALPNAFKNTSRSVSLFKFISLASELLPQTLFKSYVKMIAGLTRTEFSARCAFNMLKLSQVTTGTYAVSWDHFFHTLANYYNLMRNDFNTSISSGGEMIYRNRSTPRNITQRESEHLVAVMQLIQAVAEHDEISRIMICEQANWQPPQVLLGLVACSTPLPLKAEILFTLAALAKSKETSRAIWSHLEDSQIIPTIPVSRNFAQCSLAEEIEQNECRLEQYKLTRGILQLLYTLMTENMPKNLGVGPRRPGYDAYLNFVLESVLLKFYNRAYKDPAEKWQVGSQCLKLLYYLLATYRPRVSDFQESRHEHPYPGYHVMMQLQVKSDVLHLLLRIVEEARERLDDYNRFHGKELLEECSLYALLLLEAALAKQNVFFETHSAANCPIMLSGLNRMLLDLNPRTRKPDHVLNIVKFVTYNSWLPRHSLAAVKILSAVTQLPNVSAQILSMYAQGSNEKLEIRQGFVECLEMDVGVVVKHSDELLDQLSLNDHVPFLGFGEDGGDKERERNREQREDSGVVTQVEVNLEEGALERKPARIELQLKEAIVQLFEMNLSQQLPNFVYFLLGVDVLRDFMANEKQHLGIERHCSCVNSLVLLLEKYLEQQRHSDEYCDHTSNIVERIYHLFHGLCANRRTTETILRYFRLTCNDFLLRHLNSLPFRQHRQDHVLHAMSHLLNCVSIDVKLAASLGQTTRYNQLCDILLMSNGSEAQRSALGGLATELGHSMINQSAPFFTMDLHPGGGSNSGSVSTGATGNNGALKQPLLQETSQGLHANRLLDCLVLEVDILTQPQLEFFDAQLTTQLLKDCESSTEAGSNTSTSLINVRKLHDILHDELRMVQSTIASGQRKAISTEITLLLKYAVNLNRVRTQRCATLAFMEAWGQLVQVLFSSMPEAVLPTALRRQHIVDIIEKILIKVQPIQPIIEISIQVSETVLLLLANLRYCCYQVEDQRVEDQSSDDSLTNGNGDSQANKLSLGQKKVASAENGNGNLSGVRGEIGGGANSSNLRFILKSLVEWIMISEVKSQKLRINLYSALLNCLRIAKRLRTDEQLEYQETVISRQDNSRMSSIELRSDDRQRLREMAADVIGTFGEKLIDTICHDAVTGHDVCRMLALACLDMISELQAVSTLSHFVATRGYLKLMLDSLEKSSEDLCGILQPVPDHLRSLYVYESRMAFLTRLANTNVGAQLLLAERALGVLSNMRVYDLQPDLKASELRRDEPQAFLPAIDDRFRAILLPALSLCDAIVNSLGSRNNSASLQVLNFLFAHIDMVEAMLRTATPFMDLGHLQQLAVITNLFARTTTHEVTALEDSLDVENDLELRNRLGRLQQLMIVVFGRFSVSEATIRRMLQQDEDEHDDDNGGGGQAEGSKTLRVKYFLDIAANLSLYCRNAVTSHAKDSMTSKYLLTTMINDVTPLTGKMDSKKLTAIMHTILNQLKGSIGYYLSQKSIADNLLQQRASLPNISFGPNGKQSYMDLSQRHKEKRSELMQAVFIAEQNLYLLWIHLDFYLRNAVVYANENRNAINESNLLDNGNNASVLNASQDEILQLKQLLISTFNETFCTQLITASEDYAAKCKGFNASLLRRIKALVQFAPVTANGDSSTFVS
ncbi:nuclear pore complex protein Nup205 [Drosophila ficusphila]|uniref:nuclear pore complex protein Nup205 n=1 Tax=Drosophila ficusphila TaxID=30025 RepID=UPI0007E6B17E|nr:nuclear pore complex protein Nup205 [Drosophila ficusphila]